MAIFGLLALWGSGIGLVLYSISKTRENKLLKEENLRLRLELKDMQLVITSGVIKNV